MVEEHTSWDTSGGCRCGRYRIRVTAEPLLISYCHCDDCRKTTGAPVTVFVGFKEDDVQLEGEGAANYQSTPTVQRLYCDKCGTPIAYADSRLPGEIYYYVGIMRDPSQWIPTLHAWTSEQVEWLKISDDLPKFKGFSRQR
ncbi:MAG: GFA family protein [Gammaproteobacteria bacterium]|nr:GFA family protein [Gammaproteobacteria bacterium]